MHFSVFFFSNLFIIFAGVSVQILCTYLISFSSNWDLLLVFMPHIPYQVCNFQILSPALYPFILLQFFVYLFVQIIHPIKNTGGSDGKKKKKKKSACSAVDPGFIPGLGSSPEEGNDNPLLYPCLENSMDRRAWQATVHGVTQSWI